MIERGQWGRWSVGPRGERILYELPWWKGEEGLFIVDLTTGEERQVKGLDSISGLMPTWSADGKRMHVAAKGGAWEIDTETMEARLVWSAREIDDVVGVGREEWLLVLRQGDWIFRADTYWWVSLSTGKAVRVREGPRVAGYAFPTRDGRTAVFSGMFMPGFRDEMVDGVFVVERPGK